LGGEDFDARIIDWLVTGFQAEHNIDLRQDRMALQRLRDGAEKAKCELSTLKETEINLPFIISSGRTKRCTCSETITRDTLEKLCADLVDRTVEICKQTLADAKISTKEIEEVILVGWNDAHAQDPDRGGRFLRARANKGVHPTKWLLSALPSRARLSSTRRSR